MQTNNHPWMENGLSILKWGIKKSHTRTNDIQFGHRIWGSAILSHNYRFQLTNDERKPMMLRGLAFNPKILHLSPSLPFFSLNSPSFSSRLPSLSGLSHSPSVYFFCMYWPFGWFCGKLRERRENLKFCVCCDRFLKRRNETHLIFYVNLLGCDQSSKGLCFSWLRKKILAFEVLILVHFFLPFSQQQTTRWFVGSLEENWIWNAMIVVAFVSRKWKTIHCYFNQLEVQGFLFYHKRKI